MKKSIIFVTALLIALPLCMLAYKSQVLKFSLLPQMVDDVWHFHMTAKPKGEQRIFSFPIPKPGPGTKVTDERMKARGFEIFIDSSSDSSLATWSSKDPITKSVTYSARIDVKPIAIKDIPKDFTESYPKGLQKYLTVPKLLQEDEDGP